MSKACEDATNQIKDEIANMPQPIFNVVAKYEQKKHVAEDVRNPSMHKHRCDEREINRDWRWLQAGHLDLLTGGLNQNSVARDNISAGDDFGRNGRERVRELFIRAESLQKHADAHINE